MIRAEVHIVKKNVKHINLKVKPSGEVILTVPQNSTTRDIEYVLKKRSKWINEKVAFFDTYKEITTKEYISGESFRYLGRHYRLKVIESQDEGVKLQRGYLQVFVKDQYNLEHKKRLLHKWYIQKAKIYLDKVVYSYKPLIKKDIDRISIREMKTRWGSCNPSKGYINFNLKLIEKPKECIEYVVLHELTHLIYPNHSQHFYAYLDLHMSDWKKRKEKLEMLD